jgi:predicted dehydrogenase
VALEQASLTTIAAIALHGIRLASVAVGDRVAVIGCGLVGQIACRLLRVAGAEVFAFDVDAAPVQQAVAGGTDHGFTTDDRPIEKVYEVAPGGLDAVLVTAASGTSEPLLLAAEIARDRGTLVLVGDVPVELPRAPLHGKELSFRISRSYGPGRYDREYEERGLDYPIGYVRWTQQRNMQCVLDLQARGLLDLGPLIAAVIPVEEAATAYSMIAAESADRPRGAVLLSYPDGAVQDSPTVDESAEASKPTAAPRGRRPSDGLPRIGLIGPGAFAKGVLVPALVEAGARLELVGGGSGPSAEAAGRDLGFRRVAEDELAVINDPDIDAVVIATRHWSHSALAVRALEADKHVFCEKPLALEEEELERVLTAARESERILQVGFNRRFSPLLRELRSFIGDVRFLASYRISAGRIPASAWVHDLDEGGGRIVGEVCHFFDALVYLAGAPVDAVAAMAVRESSLPLQARDNVVVSVGFGDGSAGTISYAAAGSAGVSKERLEVFAGTQTAFLDDYRELELYEAGGRKRESRQQDKGHVDEMRAFLEGIRLGAPPVPLGEIANVSLAALAVVKSLRTGATIKVRSVNG